MIVLFGCVSVVWCGILFWVFVVLGVLGLGVCSAWCLVLVVFVVGG